MSWWVAAAQRSRALPWAWHLKQWKQWSERLAAKERLPGLVEPCSGQGPRCWEPRVEVGVNSRRARTSAKVMTALTAAKSMAGRLGSAGSALSGWDWRT